MSIILLFSLTAGASEIASVPVLETPEVTFQIADLSSRTYHLAASAILDQEGAYGERTSLVVETTCHLRIPRSKVVCDDVGEVALSLVETDGAAAVLSADFSRFSAEIDGELVRIYLEESDTVSVGVTEGDTCYGGDYATPGWTQTDTICFEVEETGGQVCCDQECTYHCAENGAQWEKTNCGEVQQDTCRYVPPSGTGSFQVLPAY